MVVEINTKQWKITSFEKLYRRIQEEEQIKEEIPLDAAVPALCLAEAAPTTTSLDSTPPRADKSIHVELKKQWHHLMQEM